MHNAGGCGPPHHHPRAEPTECERRLQPQPHSIKKTNIPHMKHTLHTDKAPTLPILLDWTQFRNQKQNPLQRLEERQRRSFSPKPRGLSMLILAYLRPPAPGPWDTRSGLVWGEGKEGWGGDPLYQVLPSLLQSPEQYLDGDWCFRGVAHWLSGQEIEVKVTHQEKCSHLGDTQMEDREGMDHFGILAQESPGSL